MSIANEPFPEKGFIKTSLVNSCGIPNMLNTGETKFDTMFESPLASKSSVKTKMLTRYGNTLTAKGTADLAPCVNAS